MRKSCLDTLFLLFDFLFILSLKLSESFLHIFKFPVYEALLLLQFKCHFLYDLPFTVFVFNVLLLSLQIIDLTDKLLILTHDSLVVSLMKIDGFFELLLQSFDSRLQMGSLFDELLLLVNTVHFLFVFLLNVFSVNFNYFELECLVVLILYKNLHWWNCGTYR